MIGHQRGGCDGFGMFEKPRRTRQSVGPGLPGQRSKRGNPFHRSLGNVALDRLKTIDPSWPQPCAESIDQAAQVDSRDIIAPEILRLDLMRAQRFDLAGDEKAASMPKPGSTNCSRSSKSLARWRASRVALAVPTRKATLRPIDAFEDQIETTHAEILPTRDPGTGIRPGG